MTLFRYSGKFKERPKIVLTVYSIPALESNYFWLLQPNPENPAAYILDPGDAEPVLAALSQLCLQLAGIVITHHHWDHTDGIDALLARHKVPVYGPDSARIPQITHPLHEGDTLKLPDLQLDVIAVPGHTLDHIAYVHQSNHSTKLFCGDALFAGGCGRMFEGSPAQMWDSLKKLRELPDATEVFCSHEYTQANLEFALKVEPDNHLLQKRLFEVQALRKAQKSTIPSTIEIEKQTNPFLRCQLASIKQAVERHAGHQLNADHEVFAILRAWKDSN